MTVISPQEFNRLDSATQGLWDRWAEAHGLALSDISRLEVLEDDKTIFVTVLHRNIEGRMHVGRACDSGWAFDFEHVCVRHLLVPYRIPVHLAQSTP